MATNGKSRGPVEAVADLRTVERLVSKLLAGDQTASQEIVTMGRDAAVIVQRLADRNESAELKELARRLVAVPPQLKTNLHELRAEAVRALIREGLAQAPQVVNLPPFSIGGGSLSLFDPERVLEELVRGGRPRQDINRIRAGDVVPLTVAESGPVEICLVWGRPPPYQPVLELRLLISSGVLFIGPTAASDGPRLGELRLDPFATRLNEHRKDGRLARVKPGLYVMGVHRRGPQAVKVHLAPLADAEALPAVDLAALGALPEAVDEGVPAE